jgi:hypothetical protein
MEHALIDLLCPIHSSQSPFVIPAKRGTQNPGKKTGELSSAGQTPKNQMKTIFLNVLIVNVPKHFLS